MMAQGGLLDSVSLLAVSSIDDNNVSMTIDWLRRQSLRAGQKISTAVGIQPCGTGGLSNPAE
ncbi:MAG: hypothetical protein HY646_03720 [Acidobacteria bacterium]|nr:hypothetical protein [Acidobacteriota bacterium]